MLLFKLASFCLILLLASCGFHPAYRAHPEQKTTDVQEKIAAIEIMPVSGRMGQELRNTLQDKLNPAAIQIPPKYRLAITLQKGVVPAAIEKDRRITRYNIIITASYVVTSIEKGTILDKGTVRVVSGYDALNSRFSTFVAEDNTTSNTVQELATELSTHMITLDTGKK